MKRLFTVLLMAGLAASLFAQVQLPEYQTASGAWKWEGVRFVQTDAKAPLAKLNVRVPQSGPMLYEFNAKYEDGAEDGHGGFGLHIFADSALNRASWGVGKSYLLWLNYDDKHSAKELAASGTKVSGLSAQIYKSINNSQMQLVATVPLSEYEQYLTWENLSQPVPFRIWVNGDTGEVRVYDPTDPTWGTYYYYNIDKKDLPLKGNWVALRTNGLKLSFGMGL